MAIDFLALFALTLLSSIVAQLTPINQIWRKYHYGALSALLIFWGLSYLSVEAVESKVIRNQKEKLLGYAPSYALVFERGGHEFLNEKTKSQNEHYQEMIDLELRWLKANPFVTDIYTMKKNQDGKIYLMVDSETDYDRNGVFEGDRESRTVIGEVYDKDLPELEGAFHGQQGFTSKPYDDKWGRWVSAFVPIRDKKGNVDGVLGIDFNSNVFLGEINQARTLCLLCFSLAYFLVFSIVIFYRRIADRNENLSEALGAADEAVRTKARFLANMSHEIRTPMNGIIGIADLLIETVSDKAVAEKIKVIQSSAHSLLELLNDILDFSKLEVDKVEFHNEPFAVHETVREIVELLKPRALDKGLNINYVRQSEAPDWIEADVVRFRQILMNLISNGIKFTHKGEISISSLATTMTDGSLLLQFSVRDTGIGISKKSQEKLFQSFSQVDASSTRRVGGSGLGLAICKGLCEKMGGKIWVQSEEGRGATFFFTFKAEKCEPKFNKLVHKDKSQESSTGPMATQFPLKILVAEDNVTNQMVVMGFLQKLGYEPDIVDNGKKVLEIPNIQAYELILMDCHMPEMDGFEATQRIIHQYGDNRPSIVALTASAMKEDIERCRACGMDDILHKPLNKGALIGILKACHLKVNEKAA